MNSTQTEGAKPKRRSLRGKQTLRRGVLHKINAEKKDVTNASQSGTSNSHLRHFPRPTEIAFPSLTNIGGNSASARTAVTDYPAPYKTKKMAEPPREVFTPKGKAPSHKTKHSASQVLNASYGSPNRSPNGEILDQSARSTTKSISNLVLEDEFRFDIDDKSSKIATKSKDASTESVDSSCKHSGVSKKCLIESRDDGEDRSASTAKPPSRLNPKGAAAVAAKRNVTFEPPQQQHRNFPRHAFSVFRLHLGRSKSNEDGRKQVIPSPPKSVSSSHSGLKNRPFVQHFHQPKITPSKIAVVSHQHKIFVVDLLPMETCDWILYETKCHTAHCAKEYRESWRKLYTHTLYDLPCSEVFKLRPLTNELMLNIRQLVGQVCDDPRGAGALVPRSWKEPHLLCYGKRHAGMCMHYDGGALTWQIMLSSQGTDYTGTSLG
jgi:hypothetical protein